MHIYRLYFFLSDRPLELEGKFTNLSSNISSNESNVKNMPSKDVGYY